MAQIIWSPTSLEDIDSIAEYISRDSPHHAALFVSRLIQATDELAGFSQMGRIIPEIGQPDCREIIVQPYRIMYRLVENRILITGIIHGARDWHPDE